MNSSNIALQIVRWAPAAAGVILIGTLGPEFQFPHWSTTLVLGLLVWGSLLTYAESTPITGPWSGARLPLTPAFEFAALLALGPAMAAVVAVLGRSASVLLRRGYGRDVLQVGTESLFAIGVAGAVYHEQGGLFGGALASNPIRFAPLGLALAAYAAALAALMAWQAAWEPAGVSKRDVFTRIQKRVTLTLVVLPLGTAMGWLVGQAGPVAAAFGLIPLLFSRESAPPSVAARPASGTTDASSLETVGVLMSAIDAFDPFTRGRSNRILVFSIAVGRELGLSPSEMEALSYGALLHDIGRTAIQLDILTSARTLEAHERAAVQTHPTIGYTIVKTLPYLGEAAEIIYAHHEQPDGRGYPRGLRGDAIPVGARIVGVAAAFDAMTQDRPYRPGLPAPTAYEELRRNAGSQFFPEVVDAFVKLHRSGDLDREIDARHDRLFTPPQAETLARRLAA